MNYETFVNTVKEARAQNSGGLVKAKIDGVVKRYGMTNHNQIIEMRPRSRRYGYYLYPSDIEKINTFEIIGHKETTLSYPERYVRDLIKCRDYLNKHRHPNLWQHLADEYNGITNENIRKLYADATVNDSFNVWQKAPTYNLPQREIFKTLTLKTAKCPEWYRQQIKEAIEKRADFSCHWQNGYDYSVNLSLGDDGKYRGWLNQEFRNCGNGHYWLLISAERAIFCEDD